MRFGERGKGVAVPKITGPTVAEHRATQHRAILDAAGGLIAQSGGSVPTLAQVAEAVGLARSSVYQYVTSRTDLVVQLLLDVIPDWTGGIADAMERAGDDPAAKLKVYADETFRLFAEGGHGPLMAAARQVPEAFRDPRVQEAHTALDPALDLLLDAAGGQAAVAARPLIDSAAQRGAELVASGSADADEIREALRRMVSGLVGDDS